MRVDLLCFVLVATLAACERQPAQGSADAPVNPVVVPGELVRAPGLPGLMPIEPRSVSATEAALIEQLLTHFPGEWREDMRQSLLDPRAGVPEMRKTPEVQAILDKIADVRKADADSIMRAQPKVFPATVAVQGSLGVSGATAIIVRRAHLVPHDVILLGEADATAAALGGAVRALVNARKKDGGIPTRDDRITVRSRGVPKSWRTDGLEMHATMRLAAARNAAPTLIAGLGLLPSFEIQILQPKK